MEKQNSINSIITQNNFFFTEQIKLLIKINNKLKWILISAIIYFTLVSIGIILINNYL